MVLLHSRVLLWLSITLLCFRALGNSVTIRNPGNVGMGSNDTPNGNVWYKNATHPSATSSGVGSSQVPANSQVVWSYNLLSQFGAGNPLSCDICLRYIYNGGWYFTDWVTVTSDSQPVTLTIQGAPGAATNLFYRADVYNDQAVPVVAYFAKDGTVLSSQVLEPGQTATYTYQVNPAVSSNLDYGYKIPKATLGGDLATGPQVTLDYQQGGNYTLNGNTLIGANGSTTDGQDVTPGTYPGASGLGAGTYSGNNIASGGPVVFNSTNTAAATDATLKAGLNAQIAELQKINVSLGKLGEGGSGEGQDYNGKLDTLIAQGAYQSNVTRNAWATYTNSGVGGYWSGRLSNVVSAAVGVGMAASNTIASAAETTKSAIQGAMSGYDQAESTGGESLFSVDIPGASGGKVELRTDDPVVTYAGAATKLLFGWLICFLLFLRCIIWATDESITAATSPQATTAGEIMAGFSVSAVSAPVMGAIIVAAIAVLPTVLVQLIFYTFNSGSMSVFAPNIGNLIGTSAYSLLCQYFPVGTLMTALINYPIAKVLISYMVLCAQCIIRLMTGL